MSTKLDKLTARKVELNARLGSANTELAKVTIQQELRIVEARLSAQVEIDSASAELEKLTLPVLTEKLERARENLQVANERVARIQARIQAISEA